MGGGRLQYIRNDQVRADHNDPLLRSDSNKHFFFRNWTQIAADFDILVLNKGAHFVHVEEHFINETRRTAEFLRAHYLNVRRTSGLHNNTHVFFRTTPSGHPHASYSSTVNTSTIAPFDPMTVDCGKEGGDEQYTYCYSYGWDRFRHRNRLAVDIFREYLGSSLTVMDVAPMTYLRPDGHHCDEEKCGDRLHYFLPSVVDGWVQMFYNLLPTATTSYP
jgi:hypothetical protein